MPLDGTLTETAVLDKIKEFIPNEESWCQQSFRAGSKRCLIAAYFEARHGKEWPSDFWPAGAGRKMDTDNSPALKALIAEATPRATPRRSVRDWGVLCEVNNSAHSIEELHAFIDRAKARLR